MYILLLEVLEEFLSRLWKAERFASATDHAAIDAADFRMRQVEAEADTVDLSARRAARCLSRLTK